MEQTRNAYRILVWKPKEKRPLGRPIRRWEDNMKMDLREVGCDPGDWTALAEDRDQSLPYLRIIDTKIDKPKAPGLSKGSNEPPGSLKAN